MTTPPSEDVHRLLLRDRRSGRRSDEGRGLPVHGLRLWVLPGIVNPRLCFDPTGVRNEYIDMSEFTAIDGGIYDPEGTREAAPVDPRELQAGQGLEPAGWR